MPLLDIAAPVKCLKQMRLILLRNADAAVRDFKHGALPIAPQTQRNRHTGRGILHRIRQNIRQNVAEQILVGFGVFRRRAVAM